MLKDQHDAIAHTETRRHGGSSIVQIRTKPKLRVSVTPCETQLFIALWSLTSTTLLLTRSHEDTKAHPSYRTGQNPSSVSPCIRVKPAPVSSALKDPHDAATEPKLRASVTPCETLLLLAQCSRAEALIFWGDGFGSAAQFKGIAGQPARYSHTVKGHALKNLQNDRLFFRSGKPVLHKRGPCVPYFRSVLDRVVIGRHTPRILRCHSVLQ